MLNWPDSSRRKVILVLKESDIENLFFEDGGNDILINDEVYVLPYSPEAKGLINEELVSPGSALIQNPFDKNIYYHESEAIDKIALAKWLHFSKICAHLGAREVKIEEIKMNEKNREDKIAVEGGALLIANAKANLSKKHFLSFAQGLSLSYEFDGGQANIQSAIEILQQTGLSRDDIMTSLVKTAQIPNNKVRKFKFNLNLTTEAHQNLEILANLNIIATRIPIFLKGKYSKKNSVKTQYSLAISVKF